jgi:hypothetical protein
MRPYTCSIAAAAFFNALGPSVLPCLHPPCLGVHWNTMELYERLRASEQSRRLAGRVLQEIRLVLEVLGDQRIPYEGEMKRFRAEGDFLVRALVNVLSTNRSHIHRLETELGELAKLADELPDVPRELLKAIHDLDRQRNKTGLNPPGTIGQTERASTNAGRSSVQRRGRSPRAGLGWRDIYVAKFNA